MALESVGVLVYNGTSWEAPKMYLDTVHTPGVIYTDRIPDTPALPIPSERYIQISANGYQRQVVTWRWDVATSTYVENWNIVETFVRPVDHGKVQYVLNGATIDNSTTTYVWVEPAWVVDTTVVHASIPRPADNGDIYWVDTNGVGTQYSVGYEAVIDNSVPTASWVSKDLVTGVESFDSTDITTVETLNAGNVSLHSTGTFYSFSVANGWVGSAVNEYLDRPSDHDTFLDWRIDPNNLDLGLVFNVYRTADLATYPPTWEYSEEWSGGQSHRYALYPPQGEVVEGVAISYGLDAVNGWVVVADATVVTYNNAIVTHNGLVVTYTV